jgi:hypothetical protein
MSSFVKASSVPKVVSPKILRLEKKCIRLADLKPGLKDWVIKVVCMAKHPMKSWQNKNGKGLVLSVDCYETHPIKKDASDAI